MRGEGSIEGLDNEAISLGTLIFDAESKLEDKNALIIVYCRQGKSAVFAAQMLVKKMQKLVAGCAESLGLSPETVASKKELSAIIVGGARESRVFSGWRRELIGDDLSKLL